jgi:poly-gamma-glutamate capsule biosynthesis protein CapA/YwtB (metallophosphatase superfamily)
MIRVTLPIVALCLLSVAAAADSLSVSGQIVAEDGLPLQNLTVHLDGEAVKASEAGRFVLAIDADARNTPRLDVSAEGYYSAVQTLHVSDFVAGAVLPTIELVRKQSGRRLILFAGDAMLSRRYFEPRSNETVLVRKDHVAQDARKLLQHVKPYVELADYASVNLETQLSSDELTDRLPKSVTFFSPPELAEALQWAGFDYVALGNNHMFDYQNEGLRSTLQTLDELKLDYSGGGFNEVAARKAAVASIGGEKHAFLSYVGWPGTFTPNQVADSNKGGAALASSDVIEQDLHAVSPDTAAIVQLHAGLEYSAHPAMSERTTLRQAVRDGADLVVAHHAHVLQGFEIVDERLIAYSMGNFLFDQYHYTTQMGMLLFVWMDGERLHRAEAVPLHINGYIPTPATGAFRYSVLHRLAKLSDPASVCMRPNGLHATVQTCRSQATMKTQLIKPQFDSAARRPVALRELGATPFAKLVIDSGARSHRLGVDILRRGDFEYAGLFGAKDRTWIEDAGARVTTGNDKHLSVEIGPGEDRVRTGQKVFERVFTSSTPATVSGRIQVDGDVVLRVLLQRRRMTDTLEAALLEGPLTEIGTQSFSSGGWQEFSFDYNQPRVSTSSVRLIFELQDLSDKGASVVLDDLSWIEWRTPWISSKDNAQPEFATHFQLQH